LFLLRGKRSSNLSGKTEDSSLDSLTVSEFSDLEDYCDCSDLCDDFFDDCSKDESLCPESWEEWLNDLELCDWDSSEALEATEFFELLLWLPYFRWDSKGSEEFED
jgi:hypothetical protein